MKKFNLILVSCLAFGLSSSGVQAGVTDVLKEKGIGGVLQAPLLYTENPRLQQNTSKFTNINFEFWNKTKQSIYATVSTSPYKTIKEIKPGQKASGEISWNRPTIIKLYAAINSRQPTHMYTIAPKKTVYIKWKNGTISPQTGPLLGKLGRTDSGYYLENNVKNRDIQGGELEQRGRRR